VIFKNLFQVSKNPELVICNLDSKIKLNFDLTIEKVEDIPAEENKNKMLQLELFYRFYFTPVKNVKYAIENFRVEQKTDYEN
jgi:DNA-directed RNA polymerase subunit alpha